MAEVSDVELKAQVLTENGAINGHDDVITISNGEVDELKAASASHHQIVKILGIGQDKGENEEEERDKGPQQALMDVGNITEENVAVTLPRKSLLKRKLDISEPNVVSSPKRIRIVDNEDVANNYIQFSDDSDTETLVGADDSAKVTQVVSCGENLTWLISPSSHIDQSSINVEFVRETLIPVKRTFSVEIDMRFILSETCTSILATKSGIATVGSFKFDAWITQHSMFNDPKLKEVSYKENFLKLANIDAVLDYDLTSPSELINKTADHQEENNIYFIGDIWQNSKGYREYLLWKTGQMEKDFSTKILALRTRGPYAIESDISGKIGITFQSKTEPNDETDLGNLSSENVESHGPSSEPFSILDTETMNSFTNFVMTRTNGKGLHTVIADNPEVSNVYESCREIRFHKYFYCECLLALRCLREGGRFVCKIFDTFTVFTNGLIFLLYKCFKSIAIHKPSSSSPYSSERFIICKGKIDNADTKYVIDYLKDCIDMVINKQEQRKIVRRRIRKRLQVVKMEVHKLVPLSIILSHAEFFQFIRESNIRLASDLAQSIGELCNLMERKDQAPLKDLSRSLKKTQQSKLAMWSMPSVNEFQEPTRDSMKEIEAFVTRHNIPIETYVMQEVKPEDLKTLPNMKELVAFPVQRYTKGTILKNTCGLFFGCGRSKIFFLRDSVWCPLHYTNFSLPRGTIVFGELAEEISVTGATRKFIPSLHLFDVIFVRGTYIGSLPLKSRQAILTRLIDSVKSDACNTHCHIVQPLNLKQLTTFYPSTKSIDLMGYSSTTRYYSKERDGVGNENCVLANGFLFFRCVEDESPSEFMKKSEQHILMWESNEDAVRCSLEDMEKFLD